MSMQCGPCRLSRLLTRACALPCSKVFGSHLDIHTGGIDLAFPHHENEIAQSEVFHQCPQWGNYFLHSGELDWRPMSSLVLSTLPSEICWHCGR